MDEHKIITVGNKLYAHCIKCDKLVQLNKFMFGSLHVCAEEPEPTSFVGVKNKYCAMGYTNVKESDKDATTKQLKRMMRKMTFNLFKDKVIKVIREGII